MQPLRNILREFIRDVGIENVAALNVLRRQWAELVGQPVAVHTYPDTVRNKVLTIIVDTPQWMHHLSFFTRDITEKLGKYNIRDIRFILGRLPERAVHCEQEAAELTEDDSRFVDNTLKVLKDDDLRKTFKKLMLHGLTKGKR